MTSAMLSCMHKDQVTQSLSIRLVIKSAIYVFYIGMRAGKHVSKASQRSRDSHNPPPMQDAVLASCSSVISNSEYSRYVSQ